MIFGNKFKIGKRCDWNDIAVGEVFGAEGCFNVAIKLEDKFLILDTDSLLVSYELGNSYSNYQSHNFWFSTRGKFYKLPKKTQELYYTPEE